MTLSVSGLNAATPSSQIMRTKINENKNLAFTAKVDNEEDVDIVDIKKGELSASEKKKIIKAARVKAAGWACIGGIFSTAYYAFRSDEKIARKFDLDVEKDKKLIKQIKKDQTVWTLPGAFLPFAGAIIAYIVANNKNSQNIELD